MIRPTSPTRWPCRLRLSVASSLSISASVRCSLTRYASFSRRPFERLVALRWLWAAVALDETITHSPTLRQHLRLDRPQTYFRTSGGLGQGFGLALGMKLAARERPVALIVGDGSFLYGPILQGLGASREHALPIMIVVLNNRGYVQMGRSHLYHYPDGAAANSEHFFGVHIEGPNYGQLAEALKLTGSRVDCTSDLISVFRRARERVSAGETSIVDVQMVK